MSIFDRFFGLGKKKPEKRQPERAAVPVAVRQPQASQTVVIRGGCSSGFDMPLEMENRPDVKRFFAQASFPYLWPEHEAYRKSVDKHDNPQDVLRDQWRVAFLNHPTPEVLIETLMVLDLQGGASAGFDRLAHGLAYSDPVIGREAARVVWTGNDWMLELTINVLGSRGTIPSGIEPDDGKRGAEYLRDTCPPARKEAFQKLALRAFGPATAGIPGKFSQEVVLKNKGPQKMRSGNIENVETYTAANKMDALRFLESRSVVGGESLLEIKIFGPSSKPNLAYTGSSSKRRKAHGARTIQVFTVTTTRNNQTHHTAGDSR